MPVLSLPTVSPSGIAFTILAVLIAAAFFVVSNYRDYVAGDQEAASDALSILQEIRRKGDITDEEFRTIQASTQQPRLGALTNDPHPNTSTDANGEAPPNSSINKIEPT